MTMGVAITDGAWAQSTPPPSFEVVVVKPAKPEATGQDWDVDGTLTTIKGITLLELIRNAYMLKTTGQVLDAPEWVGNERFDVEAKVSDTDYKKQLQLRGTESNNEYGLLLQSLLAERFGLLVRVERRNLPVYALTVDGPAEAVRLSPTKKPDGQHSSSRVGHMDVSGVTMENLAEILSGRVEVGQRVVVNRTGLGGAYDFTLDWAPHHGDGVAADATQPGLLDAVREQLGLRLREETGDVPVVVVEQVKRPEFD